MADLEEMFGVFILIIFVAIFVGALVPVLEKISGISLGIFVFGAIFLIIVAVLSIFKK